MSRVYEALNISRLRKDGSALHQAETVPAVPGAYRVVRASPAAGAPVFPYAGPDTQAAEQYRLVRARVLQRRPEAQFLAVSSPNAGDGKTVSAINLAGVFAMRGSDDVLLVGADLRHADLAERLGMPAEPGLADVLTGRCSLREAVMTVQQLPRLHVLAAGKPDASPTELFESDVWKHTCDELRKTFSLVVFDTAPIGAVADYELVQAQCDGVILVATPDHTVRKNLATAMAAIPEDKLLGLVLNGVRRWLFWRTPDYGFPYGSGNPAARSERAAAGRSS